MERNRQITEWYRSLQSLGKDDRADFEVMLLDHKNSTDASSAMLGISINLAEKGVRYDMMQLLFLAAKPDNEPLVQQQAISHIITVCWLADDSVRHDRDIQEALLDMIADHSQQMLRYLWLTYKIQQQHSNALLMKDIKQTLVYRLVAVGEEAQRKFK